MGEIERKIIKRRRISFLQKTLITLVGVSGAMSLALVFPGLIKLLKISGLEKKMKRQFSVNRSLNNLVDDGYLIFETKKGKKFLKITEKGKNFLEREMMTISKKKRRWDKKWRIVIFDIKESKKDLRDKLRNTLISIGFMKLQNSVWVYPYDCEDFIKLLKADFEIGKEILYIVADEIENSKWVKQYFSLAH